MSRTRKPEAEDRFFTKEKIRGSYPLREAGVTNPVAVLLALIQRYKELSKLVDGDFLYEISRWSWKEDDSVHTNKQIGLSIASAFYGKHLGDREKIIENTITIAEKRDIRDITASSGFDQLFQVTPGLSEEQYLLTQMLVARELMGKSLAGLDKEPEDIDLFIIATSTPSTQDMRKQIAKAIGIKNGTPSFLYVRACDSSGSAIHDVADGRKFDELLRDRGCFEDGKTATIAIFAYEDANRLSDHGGDEFSAQLFSSAASAMIFEHRPDSKQGTFVKKAGAIREVREGVDCLRVKTTYADWDLEEIALINRAPYLMEPEDGAVVEMNPSKTIKYFKPNAVQTARDAMRKWSEKTGLDERVLGGKIKAVVMHHPSLMIFNSVADDLSGERKGRKIPGKGIGIDRDKFKWVITEGNAPSAIIPIALGRQMKDFKSGDLIMILSYGAGGSFTCGIYELGKKF